MLNAQVMLNHSKPKLSQSLYDVTNWVDSYQTYFCQEKVEPLACKQFEKIKADMEITLEFDPVVPEITVLQTLVSQPNLVAQSDYRIIAERTTRYQQERGRYLKLRLS